MSSSTTERVPNVLVLIGNFRNNSGGAQRAIANQIQNSTGTECNYIVCHLFGEGSLGAELPAGVQTISLKAAHALDPRILPRLAKLCQKHEIDIVHTQSNIAGFWGRLLSLKQTSIKVISTEQNTHQRYYNLTGLMNGLTLAFADEIVCVSDSTRDSFFNWENWLLKRREILTIHNAVNTTHYSDLPLNSSSKLREELGLTPNDLVMGNIARMDSQKNQDHMIHEFASIAGSFPNAKLLIIGRGDLGDALQKTIGQLQLDNQVKIVGARSDMDNVYCMLDIFLLPSLYEGFSLALLEAMACGLPIVCSNIPQIVEATADCAITADPRKKGELAAAMSRMLEDKTTRDSYAKAAKSRAAKMFDASLLACRYEDLYKKLIN